MISKKEIYEDYKENLYKKYSSYCSKMKQTQLTPLPFHIWKENI